MWLVGVWQADALKSGGEPFDLSEHGTVQAAERKMDELVNMFRDFRYSLKREAANCWSGRSNGGSKVYIQMIKTLAEHE